MDYFLPKITIEDEKRGPFDRLTFSEQNLVNCRYHLGTSNLLKTVKMVSTSAVTVFPHRNSSTDDPS